ncbi:MAG: peptidyl-prolyl cis-trans isomerase C [Alphaproteobacteria bacterium]|jgi:peptidyl-prolyl cis-trans isomerase C
MEQVSVNDIEIPVAAIAAECQNHPAGSAEMARHEAVRSLVVRELLLQEASRLAITTSPLTDEAGRTETVEDALIRGLLADQVKTPKADDDACRRYYDNNSKRFYSADIFEASHILLSADPANTEKYAACVGEAEAIIPLLEQRPDDFENIARQRSDCSSGKEGGRLGQITRGQTTPEFETFLFALAEGQLCPQPVKTPYGIHVLRLDRRETGRIMPFELVRDLVASYIEEASWRRALSQYIRLLAGQSNVQGIDLEGTADPLIQ